VKANKSPNKQQQQQQNQQSKKRNNKNRNVVKEEKEEEEEQQQEVESPLVDDDDKTPTTTTTTTNDDVVDDDDEDLTRLDDDDADDDETSANPVAPTSPAQKSQDEQALFLAGVRSFQTSKVDEAIDFFSQVIALDPTACDAFFYRGACHYHRKDSLATIADYEALTRLAPSKAAYWSCLGDAYMNLTDELGEALRCYTRCIEVDATFAAAHYNRGMCRYKMKQYDAALQDVERALSVEPHNSNYINGVREMRDKLAHFRAQATANDDDDGLDGLGDEDPTNRDDDDDDDDDNSSPLVSQQQQQQLGGAFASVSQDAFASAVKRVGQSKVPLSNDHKLQIYALFKQASQGKCSTPQPSLINFTERAKWNAWNELGDMSRDEARARYVHMADTLCGADAVAAAKASGAKPAVDAREKNFGMGVSRPTAAASGGNEGESSTKDVCFYASVGDVKHVVELVDSGAFDVDHSDGERRTPLIWAADRNHPDMCKALLERGADVNAQDDEGQTALHYAAMCGHIEIVRVLLGAKNIDRGLCDNEGQAPFDVAEGAVKALLMN
jgi:acyl-CoA-binding protein/Tfp pilus assembly protein PilF